jgi:ribonuclease HI
MSSRHRKLHDSSKSSIADTITGTLAELGINDWDYLLIGDGSGPGSDWEGGCGWSCVLLEKNTGKHRVFWGGMSTGSSGNCELWPYVQVLLWLHARGGQRLHRRLGRALEVHVVTDSQVVVNQGNGSARRGGNAPLWAAVDELTEKGLSVRWHWKGRRALELNILADTLARQARQGILGAVSKECLANQTFKQVG